MGMGRHTKWTKEMPKNAEDYVSKNGLMDYGSTLKDFLVNLGIADDTYYRWTNENASTYRRDFCEAIKRGKERYKANLIKKAEASLFELVAGVETVDERTEYVSDASGKPIIAKKIVTKHKQEPNVAATIFALTNLKGEVWKNKQNTDVTTNGRELSTKELTVQEAREYINQLNKEI